MNRKWIIVAALLASACKQQQAAATGQAAAATPDANSGMSAQMAQLVDITKARTSPDQAVESMIKARNKMAEIDCYGQEEARKAGKTDVEKANDTVAATYLTFFTDKAEIGKKPFPHKNLSECLDLRDKFSIDIKEVKEETPTRATVIANVTNVTKIPSDADEDETSKKWRKDGVNAKYLVTKQPDGWRIAQVYSFDEYVTHDWRPVFDDAKKPMYPWLANAS